MYNILTLNKISKSGLSILEPDKFAISDSCDSPDGIIVRSFVMHDMELPKSVKAIARAGAGVNNIPISKCSERGIVVFNTPGANANAVKELVIASLMLSSRKIVDGINWAQTLKGSEGVPKQIEKGKSAFAGPEVMGKKIGVVGLGAIGVLVANACDSLGMEVCGYDPFLSVESAWAISRGVTDAKSLDQIYANSDYITLHVPSNSETKHMINAETIAKMKDGVRILNLSRAELVNDDDMKAALESGKVAAYVTDFPNDNILGAKNVITIPHLGASTPESEENCALMASNQIRNYLENGNIVNSVNLPNSELARTTDRRICVIHKNIPNVINPLTHAVSSLNINIENMLNRSKGDYAYTIIDINADDSAINDIESKLNEVDGVIYIRII